MLRSLICRFAKTNYGLVAQLPPAKLQLFSPASASARRPRQSRRLKKEKSDNRSSPREMAKRVAAIGREKKIADYVALLRSGKTLLPMKPASAKKRV